MTSGTATSGTAGSRGAMCWENMALSTRSRARVAAAATCSKCVTTGGIDTVGRRATTGATTRDHSIPPHETIPNWNVGVIATAKRIRETARAVHCVIALTGAGAEQGGAEVASTIESAAVRGAWWMLKVERPVDGLYADTAGDHVAWCVEGSNAALTAPEMVNIHIGTAVYPRSLPTALRRLS